MLGDKPLVAFVATTKSDEAKAFYGETLGLRLVEDTPFALVYDANGTTLRVQRVETCSPPPFTQLGWHSTDVPETVRDLAARGVAFERFGFFEQDELGIWTAPDGTPVAWFKDPEGYTLSINGDPRA
jgi:catechol 2,3-dioxygenase-like lactoylglutathione lyase family enzyme